MFLLLKRLVFCILYATLTNLGKTQSRFDMYLDSQPKIIDLPSDYAASQVPNL